MFSSFGRMKKQTEAMGKANPYSRFLRIDTGQRRKQGVGQREVFKTVENPYYQSPESITSATKEAGEKLAEQARLQTESFEAARSDIANQLKIIQGEKSAVSKMIDEYRKMLLDEAEIKRKAQEESKRSLQIARANQARAGQQASFQIQPARQAPTTGGTQGFRARPISRLRTSPLTSSLNIGTNQMLNI